MISLGPKANVGILEATSGVMDSLSVGSISAVPVGSDSLNSGIIGHENSIFYLKFEVLHQVAYVATANASSTVTLETTADHHLSVGDTVHVGSGLVDDNFTIAGIDRTDLIGTHVVTVVPSADNLSFVVASTANADDVVAFEPHMRVDRYKYIDMADVSSTWSHSTTLPTSKHTNAVGGFYF